MKKIIYLMCLSLSFLLMSFAPLTTNVFLYISIAEVDNLEFERAVVGRNMANVDSLQLDLDFEFQAMNFNHNDYERFQFSLVNLLNNFNTIFSVDFSFSDPNLRLGFQNVAITPIAASRRLFTLEELYNLNYFTPPNNGLMQRAFSVHLIDITNEVWTAATRILNVPQSNVPQGSVFHISYYGSSGVPEIEELYFNQVNFYINDFLVISKDNLFGAVIHIQKSLILTSSQLVAFRPMFSRDLNSYIDFRIELYASRLGNVAYLTINDFSKTMNFRTTHGFSINHLIFAQRNLFSEYFSLDLSFNLYDAWGFNYATVIPNNPTHDNRLNLLELPNRLQELFGFSINYNFRGFTDKPIVTNFSSFEILRIYEFNLFNFTELTRPPVIEIPNDNGILPPLNTQDCVWFNVFCHIQNAVVWFLTDFPPMALIWNGIDTLLIFFNSLAVIVFSFFGFTFGLGTIYEIYTIGSFLGLLMSFGLVFGMWRLFKLIKGAI